MNSARIWASSSFFSKGPAHRFDIGFALAPFEVNFSLDGAIGFRIELLEGEVFEFPANARNAQAMGQGRVNIETFPRHVLSHFGRQGIQGSHVVQAVAKFDEHDAHVVDHGEEHFAKIFDLIRFARIEGYVFDFAHALDEIGDVVAKAMGDLFARRRAVPDGVVQNPRGHGCGVLVEFREDAPHLEGMRDIGLARLAEVMPMCFVGKMKGAGQKFDIAIGMALEGMLEKFVKGEIICEGLFGLRGHSDLPP